MFIRGTDIKIPIEYVRMQPYVSPKIELSDQRQERVDVRVLPIIFRFPKPKDVNIYPGQLVDVYLGAKEVAEAVPRPQLPGQAPHSERPREDHETWSHPDLVCRDSPIHISPDARWGLISSGRKHRRKSSTRLGRGTVCDHPGSRRDPEFRYWSQGSRKLVAALSRDSAGSDHHSGAGKKPDLASRACDSPTEPTKRRCRRRRFLSERRRELFRDSRTPESGIVRNQ